METIKIKLVGGFMPKKANATDAAWDLYVPEDVVLKNGRQIINMKFCMEIPIGYAATIQPRSGFSAKGIEVERHYQDAGGDEVVVKKYRLDADIVRGLVDSKYRDPVGVIVKVAHYYGIGNMFVVKKGTKIAQMQIIKLPDAEMVEVEELDMEGNRGGGFGHTGTK